MNLFTQAAQHQGFSIPLHALRGIAAILVLFSHIQLRVTEGYGAPPIPHIFNGSGAVTFFFVLSGLVVGAALAKQELTQARVMDYLHRRVFRIMPLMFVTVTIGSLYLVSINDLMRYPLYDKQFGDFSFAKFISAYVGYSAKPNHPIWSIYVEIIASLLIPLMILCGRRLRDILLALAACVALSLVGVEFQHHWNFYMVSFYLGLTILLWGQCWANWLAKLPVTGFWLLLGALFCLFYGTRLLLTPAYGTLWIVYWETLLITPIIAAIYYLPARFSLLAKPVFKFLGDISYSLYLTHWLLLVVALNVTQHYLGDSELSMGVYCLGCLVMSLFLAHYSFKYVELPGIKLGEQLRQPLKALIGYSR